MKHKIKNYLKTLLVILLTITVTTGCQSQTSGSYSVVDSRNQTVEFDKVPEKVISLLPSNTEILYALGQQDKVIGVSAYDDYPAEVSEKPKLDTGTKLNVEQVIAMKPDLVVAGKMDTTSEQYTLLEQAGIKVIVTDAQTIAQTYDVMNMIGKVFGVEKQSKKLVDDMKKDFEDLKAKYANQDPTTVYLEVSPVIYGPWTAGSNTFQNELLEVINAKNVFDDIDGWAQVSEEQIIKRDPQAIITSDEYSFDNPVQEIKDRKSWQNVSAIKNDKVFLINAGLVSRSGPRLVEAAQTLADMIYGTQK